LPDETDLVPELAVREFKVEPAATEQLIDPPNLPDETALDGRQSILAHPAKIRREDRVRYIENRPPIKRVGSLPDSFLNDLTLPNSARRAFGSSFDKPEEFAQYTPGDLMGLPEMGEGTLTKALDEFALRGISLRVPEAGESIHNLGLTHHRDPRLFRIGINTVGQLVEAMQDPNLRKHINPDDAAVIEHRLKFLGLLP
jgi:hypothetical protein